MRVLRVPGAQTRRIGKIDFMLSKLGTDGKPVDFCALEVQGVYISGKSIRPAFDHFLKTGELKEAARRPDFRSSAQKRLMPQLSLKVPIFRRWGKKFFVVVDDSFFNAMPRMRTVSSAHNAEVTWLVYPLVPQLGGNWAMSEPQVHHTHWDDVLTALREGEAPEPAEVLADLAASLGRAIVVST